MIGRTHHCGQLSEEQVNERVQLKGWVQRRRDLGQVIFVDLRDRSGVVQLVFNSDISQEALETAEKVRNEYVLDVEGVVLKRDPSTVNDKIATGTIEVHVERLTILNKAKSLPFQIEANTDASEDIRLKYRYLDLRRPDMQETMKLRHQTTKLIRDFLDGQEFFEIETPMLTKSTPEGARDYLVPSRVHHGEFYALPQSPQIFKQLLMVSGFERYYQIVRCFRDEDLRADRQPEFTQIDIETSFMDKEDLLTMTENMMAKIMKEVKGLDVALPFPRMTYDDAMNRYGSDKPDTRFEMELIELSDIVKDSDFKVFSSAIKSGGIVKGLNLKGGAGSLSRKEIDGLAEFVKPYGAKGLAWLKVEEDELKGPIAKFFAGETGAELQQAMGAEDGDLLFFAADKKEVVFDSLGALRLKLGKDFNLIDESKFNFLWVVDFPLVEYDEEAKRFVALHHPFTSPKQEDLTKLETDPASVRADAYDLVLNGYELGGGSQRIYQRPVQEKMFAALGFTEEAAQKEFGFLLEAFEYGTPPHGGIALGLDRLVMLLAGRSNLRDTIAFPKTASASCLLTEAPGEVSLEQLLDLNLSIIGHKLDKVNV
ncbi:aspartate--tRNA ligase [Halalkalibacterium halodurans]|uniref:aspartate--tRNA ligase n=1 Tax=Halalkalibacterium halodurans TaxID=86665 RepID=UPI002E1A9F0F|nr:aspartate--tRNA ligase [Halalkalibacterium halodurans]MED4083014.1 aspartate--tRNA ligase [Halalkalibacterium halodurans]MED4087216.1 aspartate--tRNA ligase [Halalkalibacterium halodurans]MED4106368.1 aspartate--tRNA ligase [Halalkalibacterium halodurans]MED4122432.1 aspartate--tRNA ligase [Halalkalibacterium halodurans]MED4151023.1 aspartate--tRNA ligase [Halalkalibacterium halodurans]